MTLSERQSLALNSEELEWSSDDGYEYPHPKSRWLSGNVLSIIVSLTALALTVSAIFTRHHEKLQAVASERISLGTCGRNWQEAEANGCVYDVMMTAWMKPQCYDKELSDAFFYRDSGNWTFYHDSAGKDVMPHDELFRGRYTEYWVQVGGTYHFSHCSYIWAKQLKQMGKKPMVLDSKSRNWYHTLHCANMLAAANTTYLDGRASSHAKLGTSSIDCIVGDWSTFESIPAELQKGAGPLKEE
ncbi:uncharacterized protein MYCFIDRAFT_173540 [Pseudocercospora fijiensis CIRAD86]|uniref:Uncharacterized protein n=1 Tax=Pseudocercospora fijiensis (strain CIRAD86) TaxID=383855 RepID=M3A083_PSEFD|nr:uncharacterized protein MYCFIDRAFT_173540 [Pseudocercospora fijiensis CIRAD86]EME84579.1 hypothetical protein MYCFIDRAFT_173540 [Pseudocercospora fijiensis CIRAD86]